MNKIVMILTTIILTACTSTLSKPALNISQEVNEKWQTLDSVSYQGKRDDISFISSTHGWYGTGKGDLYSTIDGGTSWNLVTSRPGTFIRALGFINESTGYIGNVGTDYYPGVSDENPLYKTTDGGRTWSAVDTGNSTIKGVCAIDILQTERIFQGDLVEHSIIYAAGRVGGPAGILRSIDSGENWSVINMSEHAGMILDLKFFTEDTGLVFASTSSEMEKAEGLILRTEDGGKNWTRVYTSGRKMELIWKGSFIDDAIGYATVQSYDKNRSQQLIVKTTDGGRSWTELPLVKDNTARQFGIGFVDENHGWVGTMAGGFYTNDGGKSFVPAPVAKAANKFRIVDSDNGAVVFSIGTEIQKLFITRK